jgi:hypothetical protein
MEHAIGFNARRARLGSMAASDARRRCRWPCPRRRAWVRRFQPSGWSLAERRHMGHVWPALDVRGGAIEIGIAPPHEQQGMSMMEPYFPDSRVRAASLPTRHQQGAGDCAKCRPTLTAARIVKRPCCDRPRWRMPLSWPSGAGGQSRRCQPFAATASSRTARKRKRAPRLMCSRCSKGLVAGGREGGERPARSNFSMRWRSFAIWNRHVCKQSLP